MAAFGFENTPIKNGVDISKKTTISISIPIPIPKANELSVNHDDDDDYHDEYSLNCNNFNPNKRSPPHLWKDRLEQRLKPHNIFIKSQVFFTDCNE